MEVCFWKLRMLNGDGLTGFGDVEHVQYHLFVSSVFELVRILFKQVIHGYFAVYYAAMCTIGNTERCNESIGAIIGIMFGK